MKNNQFVFSKKYDYIVQFVLILKVRPFKIQTLYYSEAFIYNSFKNKNIKVLK